MRGARLYLSVKKHHSSEHKNGILKIELRKGLKTGEGRVRDSGIVLRLIWLRGSGELK